MDLAKLRAEIIEDPLGLGYADMSDSQVADHLNAPSVPARGVVPASDVRSFVLLNGIWPALSKAAQATDPVLQGTAETIIQTLAPNSFDTIRMNDEPVFTAVQNMLGVMVAAGVMTEAQRDQMIALGDTRISRAQELGLETVHHLQVGEARLMEG